MVEVYKRLVEQDKTLYKGESGKIYRAYELGVYREEAYDKLFRGEIDRDEYNKIFVVIESEFLKLANPKGL